MMKKINILKSMLLLSFLTIGTNAFAQKIPANSVQAIDGTEQGTSNIVSKKYLGNLNDLLQDNNSSVTLISSALRPASLEFNYSNLIPANKPYYFRLKSSSSFSGALLGGAVGGFLDALIFGVHTIEVNPYNGTQLIAGGGSTDNYWNQTGTNNLAVMTDGNNQTYIRILPIQEYNRITFIDKTPSGLEINESELEFGYYYQNQTLCDVPLMTSFTGSGGLLSVGSQNPVIDAYKAIDTDLNTYAAIGGGKLLDVALGSEVEQFFYLPSSTNNKMIRLKMSIPSGLLNVDIANQSQIVFYKNNVQVGSVPINSDLLGVDLLGLVNANNNPLSFIALPPLNAAGDAFVEFDKVSVKIIKPVNVNLLAGNDLRIYDVALVDTKAEVKKVCSRESVTNNIRERKFDIRNLIPGFSAANRYLIVDQNQNVIIDQLSTSTYPTVESVKWQPLGTYYIKGINAAGYCPNDYVSIIAEQDKQYTIAGKSAISLPLDSNNDNIVDASFTFSSALYSSDLPDNTGVRIYDELTNVDVTDQTINFPAIGSYNYYAKSVNAVNDASVTCDIVKRITVYVYDQEECEYRYVQTLARNSTTGQVLTGGTSDSAKAADDDLSTHGTVFNVLNLAGIGSAWIDLTFDDVATNPIPKGTPLAIKLGQEYSLLQLIGGTTIQTLNKDGLPVGNLISLGEVDLLNVLVGDNVFEFIYTPEDGVPAEGYGGVRIISGGLLGVATSTKVFGAYIDKRIPISQAGVCDSNIEINGAEVPDNLDAHLLLNTSTDDVLYGVQDAGLGVATALSGVAYAYLAADAIEDTVNVNNPLNGTPNYQTAAIFNTSVGALNRQTLTVKFKDIARPGDKVRITMSAEGAPVLDLNLLSNFTVQRYLGETPIGDVVTKDEFSLIKLDLLKLIADQASNKYVLTLEGIGASFDRVELRMDNVVSANLLGTRTYIYDVSVIPNFEFDENVTFCTSAPFRVEKLDPCSGYDLSFAYATLGTVADPITGEFEILGWNDIQNSTLPEIDINDPRYDDEYHQYQLNKLYGEYSSVNNLYLKVVTKRQGCIYGDTQYFRIKIKNCGSISNPMIRTRLKSN